MCTSNVHKQWRVYRRKSSCFECACERDRDRVRTMKRQKIECANKHSSILYGSSSLFVLHKRKTCKSNNNISMPLCSWYCVRRWYVIVCVLFIACIEPFFRLTISSSRRNHRLLSLLHQSYELCYYFQLFVQSLFFLFHFRASRSFFYFCIDVIV